MIRTSALAAVLTMLIGFPALAQSSPPLSLSFVPSFDIPMGADSAVFALGGGGSFAAEYRFPSFPLLIAGAQVGYSYVPLTSITSMSLISGGALAGARYDFTRNISARATAGIGYFYAFLNDGSSTSGSNPFVSLGADVSWMFDPTLSLGLGAAWRNFFGLYNDIAVTLGVSYSLAVGGGPVRVQEKSPERPVPLSDDKGLQLGGITLNKVFPIFHAWYDTNPVGKVTITNTGSSPATDIKVSLNIREYMDAPKDCAVIPSLGPGESKDVDLLALFKGSILEITQTTKVAAQIDVSYTRGGRQAVASKVETLTVYDRNAMTWDDNQKAAAFVTPKEPVVLFFSNNVNAMVKDRMNRVMDRSLQTAMAYHDALRLYGISYVSPPLTSYAVVSQNKQAVDSLKFPRETFSYRSGDCSDLAILYCSLLESVQVETAFVTVPGHIFMAFALGLSEDEARKAFTKTDELIFQGGKAWVPVEVTERNETFVTAWQEGAKEWREGTAKKQADFYPVRKAWQTYEAVFFPGSGTQPALPDAKQVIIDFQGDLIALISREIGVKENEYKAAIKKNPSSTRAVNALGLLYARYDLEDKAEAQFQTVLQKEEYVPALLNLGNMYYLKGDYEKSQSYYQRAFTKSPHNANVLLCMARVNHEQQNYGSVKKYYQELQTVAPDMAETFAYLDLQGPESTRAAEVNHILDTVVWEEDK